MMPDGLPVVPVLELDDRLVRTIVFSTDENFVAPAGVAITSLLQTISSEVFCDVVVLDNGLSSESREKLTALGAPGRSAVRFCNVVDIASDAPVHTIFTKATYLRLFVPFLFKNHERVLYLDCDILVRKDVSKLFETEFSDECIAVTSDVGIVGNVLAHEPVQFKGRKTTWTRYAKRHLRVPTDTPQGLVNAGVLLFNIPACSANHFEVLNGLDRHIRFGYLYFDQCIIARMFFGRIKHLHVRWNYQVKVEAYPPLPDWLNQEGCEAREDPCIIHYITGNKPWTSFDAAYDAWWAVARGTVFFGELLERRLNKRFCHWLYASDAPSWVEQSHPPVFTIVMPVYNRADVVSGSLKSIQMQDFSSFEVLVIDDASTDGTAEVVAQIAENDTRIRLIQMEKNVGPGPARNAGIAQARGRYIRVCDSDDFYPPGALAAFARQIETDAPDLIVGNLLHWNHRQRRGVLYQGPATVKRDVQTAELMELPELWEMINFHRCAFRREFLQKNRIEYSDLRRGEDPVYMSEVVVKARSFALFKDPVYLFHCRPRDLEFSFQTIRDAYHSYERVWMNLIEAGYCEIAFFFFCYHSPFSYSYVAVSDEESVELAEQLMALARNISDDVLEHPFLKHPSLDYTGLVHDLLIAKNSTSEAVADLIKRGVFCGLPRVRDGELWQLRQKLKGLRRQLRPFRFPLRIYRGLKRRIGFKIPYPTPRRKNPIKRVAPRAYSPVQQKIEAVHERLPPRFLLFDINQLCNLRCTHCDVWKNRPEEVVDTRTHERIREVIAEFAQLSPYGTVVTCGGEPMIDPDEWFWLCQVVREQGLPFFSVVNGTFIQTPEMADRVLLEGADEITISLDHYIPEIHDRLRGVPGAFEKATRALRLLLEARERHSEHHKPIMVMGLIGKTTYRELEAFHDFVLNEIGADKLKLNMVQPSFSTALIDDRFFEEEGDVNPRLLRKILNRCNKRFSLGMNPVWKDTVVMYFRSISRCNDREKGWHSGARTDECICNAVDRDIVLDIYGMARYCFSRNFLNFPIQKPGDLKTFWENREEWRDQMNACNLCCGISHSLRAESGTLVGVRKAEEFIRKSLEFDRPVDSGRMRRGDVTRLAGSFLSWLDGWVAPPATCSEEPLFSIILPVHNREADIAGCLKSIQLQDFTDFEIVLIDDASSDGTAAVVTRLAQCDPHIKLIRLEKNIGPGPARNIGIQKARGKYIRICDSDDFYPPGALSAFALQIAEEESDLIAGNLISWHSREQKVRPHSGPWQIDRVVRSQDLRQLPELWAMVHFHRCAFRREFLMENEIEYPAMRRGEDPVYMANVLTKARSFSLFPDPVYLFHERPRDQQFAYEDIRDAVSAHTHIRQVMRDAGHPELGFFFDCYFPPFTLSHAQLTDEESVKISEKLIEFASHLPSEIFEHPYLDHPSCDKTALRHDVLVAKNSSPEQVSELARRGMFCGLAHIREAEIQPLMQKVRSLRRQRKLLRVPIRIYRGLRRRIVRSKRA